MLKQSVLLIFFFVISAVFAPQLSHADELRVGQEMPNIKGLTADRKEIELTDYKGNVVLIDFWATWCGPCLGEFPELRNTYAKYNSAGLEIIGVSLDEDRDKLISFMKDSKTALPWDSIYDKGGSFIGLKYNVNTIPHTILIDRQGKIVAIGARGTKLTRLIASLFEKEKASKRNSVNQIATEESAPKIAPQTRIAQLLTESPEQAMEETETLLNQRSVDKATALYLAELLQRKIPADSYGALDTAAFAYYKGDQKERALNLQKQNYKLLMQDVNSFLETLSEDEKTKGMESVSMEGTYMTMTVRLALYHAAQGQTAEAEKLMQQYDGNLKAKGYLFDLPAYKELANYLTTLEANTENELKIEFVN